MKYLLLLLALASTGCIDKLAYKNLYPYDIANKTPSTKTVGLYPNVNGPVIFYLHGNAENIASLEKVGMTKRLQQIGYVYVPEYPGYGPLPGPASQKAIMNVVRLLYRQERAQWVDRKIFIVGRSLGAAVAMQLASEGADGLILISPWTSFKAAAKATRLGFLTGLISNKFMNENSWDSLGAAGEFKGTAATVHGLGDTLIPYTQGKTVANALGGSHFYGIAGAGHNDLFAKQETWKAIEGVLK